MTPARVFAILELSLLVGVAGASIRCTPAVVGSAALLAVASLWFFVPTGQRRVLLIVPCVVVLGAFRVAIADQERDQSALRSLANTTTVVTGIVGREVDRRLDAQRLTVTVTSVEQNGAAASLHERLLVTTGLFPEFAYGDRLRIRCRLAAPEPFDRFAYDDYLALSRIYTVCRSPLITLLEHGRGNLLVHRILQTKTWFLDRLNTFFPEPQASLIAGILVGARRAIPPDLQTTMQRVGLTHIVALSGYNITIIVTMVFVLALHLGMGRRRAFWVIAAVLVSFLVFTGAPSSVVRASVMGVLVLIARRVGRMGRIWYALIFAATVMTLLNPRMLLHDAGFQLSFLATIGLVSVAPLLEPRLRWIPQTLGLQETMAATLGATIMTTPLIALQFGRMSLISPLVNAMVLPTLSIITILGFAAVLVPLVGPMLAPAVWLLLAYLISVSEWFARLPFASVPVPELSPAVLVVCYAVLILFLARWNTHQTNSPSS